MKIPRYLVRSFLMVAMLSPSIAFSKPSDTHDQPAVPINDSTKQVAGLIEADSHSTSDEEEILELPTFSVSAEQEEAGGKYQAADAISSFRIKTDLLLTPASISIVTNTMVTEHVTERMLDALRYLPGVTESNSPNVQDRVTIRGFYTNNSGYLDGLGWNGTNNIDPILIERVEMLGGPNAILTPNGLPGGTINTVTKSPSYRSSKHLSATVGQYNSNRMDIDLTGPLGEDKGLAFRLVASNQDANKVTKNTKVKNTILFPALTYKRGNLLMTLKFIYNDYLADYEGTLPVDPSSSSTNYAKPLNGLSYTDTYLSPLAPGKLFRASTSKLTNLLVTKDISSHITGRLFIQYQDTQIDGMSAIGPVFVNGGSPNPLTGLFTPGINYGPGPTYTPAPAPQQDWTDVGMSGGAVNASYYATALQNDYVMKYLLPHKVESTTTMGWQTSETKYRNIQNAVTTNRINVYDPVFTTVTMGTPNVRNSTTNISTSAYVLQQMSFFSNRAILSGGLQRMLLRLTATNDLLLTKTQARITDTLKFGSVLVAITPSTSIYASYSENANPVNSLSAGAAYLLQDGSQKEIGLKKEFFDRRLRFTAAFYEIVQTNFATANAAFLLDPSQPQNIFLDVKSRGQEYSLTGKLTKNLDIVTSVSRNHIRDPLGRRLRTVPDISSSALVSYTWLAGSLKNASVNGGISYIGSRAGDTQAGLTTAGVPIQPSMFLAPLTLVNVGASYTYGRYDYKLSVSNLMDKKYLAVSSRAFAYPTLPRNIVFRVGVRF